MLKKTLIIGAGEAGKMVARELLDTKRLSLVYTLFGFLDDDPKKKSVWGIPVLGNLNNAEEIIKNENIQAVIICIPSASREIISDLLIRLSRFSLELKIVPGIFEIIEGDVHWRQVREVKPEDLLGREEVGFDLEEIASFYHDKTIFVTGAGGSIGSEIFRQLLKVPIKKAIAMGRGENNIHYLMTALSHDPRIDYVIGDVRDHKKIEHEIARFHPDILFHAAAHKHVPMMEEFPEEAVKNNILGTYHSALAAINNNVGHFVFVSTDKAVNPRSVMGATKRVSERIILSMNAHEKTRFILTRFGNVLGSRGSVIPTFVKQIDQGGPVTITHPEIERYFMSIPEASRLVIKAATLPQGKIFVLNMGKPIKILDLAKNLIKLSGFSEEEIPITFTGLRKGEKIQEELFTLNENLSATRFDKLMISQSEQEIMSLEAIATMIEEFKTAAYAMDQNQVRRLLKKYVPEFQGMLEN